MTIEMQKKSILVTGGAGFIGSHLAIHLVNQGHRVTVLDNLSGGYIQNLGEPISANFVRGDILDQELLAQLFEKHKFDVVYHLACFATEGLSHYIRSYNYTNNLLGSINLINEAIKHQVSCFVFTSSMAVYGENQVPFHEALQPAPEDPYGIAKAAVERDLLVAHRMFGLPYIIFRPHSVIGPHQNLNDPYRNVAGIFMSQCMRGLPMSIFGDGEQVRAFSYVGDMVPLIAESFTNPAAYQQIFNIGGETPITINRLSELVAAALGVPHSVVHTQPRYEVKVAYSGHDRLWEVFGRRPLTPLEDGIQRMADWAKRRGLGLRKKFANIEIERGLPSFWKELQ